MLVPQGQGKGGKGIARVACLELMEVLRLSLKPLYTPCLCC